MDLRSGPEQLLPTYGGISCLWQPLPPSPPHKKNTGNGWVWGSRGRGVWWGPWNCEIGTQRYLPPVSPSRMPFGWSKMAPAAPKLYFFSTAQQQRSGAAPVVTRQEPEIWPILGCV